MDVITFPESLKTTSCLSILLHGVSSNPPSPPPPPPDMTSCDDLKYGIAVVQLTCDIEAPRQGVSAFIVICY